MKIVTDSACDMPREELNVLGITVAPLQIQFPNLSVGSNEISPDDFYTRLRQMHPNVPTTSQPSAGLFERVYCSLLETGEEILSIHISSGLSGTIESARLGAQHLPGAPITFIDSLTLSGGQRFQVLAAALWGRRGLSTSSILDRLKKIRSATEVAFTLETTEYLARGGRIGRVQALAGALLKIKPVIDVDKDDGKYNSIGRARTVIKAMEAIVERNVHLYGEKTALRVSIMHGQFQEQAELLASMLSKRLTVTTVEILRISPVLGVHTGPGVVGAAVVPEDLLPPEMNEFIS